MKKKTIRMYVPLICCLLVYFVAFMNETSIGAKEAQGGAENAVVITIDTKAPGTPLSGDMYGIFFEEINHSGDGGLYAEMIANRSFEDWRPPEGMEVQGKNASGPNGWKIKYNADNKFPQWKFLPLEASATITLDQSDPIHSNNPSSARIDIQGLTDHGAVLLENNGYWGIAVQKDAEYLLSFYAKTDGKIKDVDVVIPKLEGYAIAAATISGLTKNWKKYEVTLKATEDYTEGRLVFSFNKPGTIWLDEISLFPKKTWNNRPNGLRVDLMRKLHDLKPAFVRFPGGCFVEGCTLANAFLPTTTLGPTEFRPSRWNLWNYRSTQGLGLHEYLQMAEDLGAASMLVVNCGMACEGRDGGNVPLDKLQSWIDEASNAIEYAIGGPDTTYGAKRVKAGHPDPFHLKYVEIGNENWSSAYKPRYSAFYKALKEKYPHLIYISNIELDNAPVDIRDDHYYNTADWFCNNAGHYDMEPRSGRLIYIGEYAANRGVGKGNLSGALGEAAFMIGMERNADLVTMASYAPLFYNVNDRCWPVNLIGFDNVRSFGTPSYYVQKLFATERGDTVLPTEVQIQHKKDVAIPYTVGLGTWNTKVETKDWEIIRSDGKVEAIPEDQTKKIFAELPKHTATPVLAFIPKLNLTGDYSVRFKARKLDGTEGFLILFDVTDKNSYTWFNRAGWSNSRDGVEVTQSSAKNFIPMKSKSFTKIKNNVWYEYEIRIKGKTAVCLENGQEIMSCQRNLQKSQTVTALAQKDSKTGTYIVKIVNFSDKEETVRIQFTGLNKIGKEGTRIVLSSKKAEDENTLEEPEKVVPKTQKIEINTPIIPMTLAPNSLTILKVK